MVDESHTKEMRTGKRHFSISPIMITVVLSFCAKYFPDERNTFSVEMDFDELPVQNIQLRFTASAVVVRIFWRRLTSFTIFGSFCFQQFEIHIACPGYVAYCFFQYLLRVFADWPILTALSA